MPRQALFATENGPKVKLSDLLAGIGSVSWFTRVSGFETQEGGPLKTILTVKACRLFVQLVTEGVTKKFVPRPMVDGLMLFSAYRQETE